MTNERLQRFETLISKFQRNKKVSRKTEVLRLLLELSGSSLDDNSGGFQSDSISQALMTSMV